MDLEIATQGVAELFPVPRSEQVRIEWDYLGQAGYVLTIDGVVAGQLG